MEGDIGHLIVDRLLSWPTYLFVALMVLLFKYGEGLGAIISSRKVDVDIAGNKVSIGDAVEVLDMETKQALDDFRRHQEQIDGLDRRIAALEGGKDGAKPRARSGPPTRDDIFARMVKAITESRFKWRSVERLAIEAGVTVPEAHDILAAHHPNDVVLGKDKAGRAIARLP